MAELLTKETKLERIRERVEAQRSRYGARWNQILKDRADLLAMVDNRNHVIGRMLNCADDGLCSKCRKVAKELISGRLL